MKTLRLLPILVLFITAISCSQKKQKQDSVTDHLASVAMGADTNPQCVLIVTFTTTTM